MLFDSDWKVGPQSQSRTLLKFSLVRCVRCQYSESFWWRKCKAGGIPSAPYDVHPQTVEVCHCRTKEPLVGRDVREGSSSTSHSPGLAGAASWPHGARCRAPTKSGLQGWAVHSSISFNLCYPVSIPSQITTQMMFKASFFGNTSCHIISHYQVKKSLALITLVLFVSVFVDCLVCKHALVAHPNCRKSWLSHYSQCLQDELSCTYKLASKWENYTNNRKVTTADKLWMWPSVQKVTSCWANLYNYWSPDADTCPRSPLDPSMPSVHVSIFSLSTFFPTIPFHLLLPPLYIAFFPYKQIRCIYYILWEQERSSVWCRILKVGSKKIKSGCHKVININKVKSLKKKKASSNFQPPLMVFIMHAQHRNFQKLSFKWTCLNV